MIKYNSSISPKYIDATGLSVLIDCFMKHIFCIFLCNYHNVYYVRYFF